MESQIVMNEMRMMCDGVREWGARLMRASASDRPSRSGSSCSGTYRDASLISHNIRCLFRIAYRYTKLRSLVSESGVLGVFISNDKPMTDIGSTQSVRHGACTRHCFFHRLGCSVELYKCSTSVDKLPNIELISRYAQM